MVTDERAKDGDSIHEIEPAVQDELVKHPGKWASLTRTKIIAIRDTSTEAYAAARDAGIEEPSST